jgi:hypothetical protein
MANCQTATTNTVTYTGTDGHRILTPVEGATSNMYFGVNRTSTVFRIIRWPESSTTLSQFDRTLSHGSVFANPDCRGGTGNFDFIERSTSWSISGFRLRGAVVPGSRLWFMWNVASDSSHTQAHLHSALFTEPGLAALTPTHLFNNSTPFCIGYPTLSSNASGFFGLTVAAGGRAGGGGRAAEGYVSVDDNNTTGNSFAVLTKTASGTHNQSDHRYGDYFTIRKSAHCRNGWVATNYSLLNGNTLPSHVNARYVEFASNNNTGC